MKILDDTKVVATPEALSCEASNTRYCLDIVGDPN